MEEIVYLNGSLLPRSQAKVSVFDHGFLYGYGLFETMRAYHGKIFLLDRHLRRLMSSAEVIGLASRLAAAVAVHRIPQFDIVGLHLVPSGEYSENLFYRV